jgi:hypothetical protein
MIKQERRKYILWLLIIPSLIAVVMALFSGCVVTHDVREPPECDDSTLVSRPHPAIGDYNVYYGNFHNHSNASDGKGTPEQAYRYARCVAGLDFFGLADHDGVDYTPYLDDTSWLSIKNAADLYDADGSFAAFWGFECTAIENKVFTGHITVVGTDDFTSYLTNPQPQTFQWICSWLSKRNCFAILNHPGKYDSYHREFDHFQGPVCDKIVGIELWNMYPETAFNQYYYYDGYFTGDSLKGYYDEGLSRGWKIGAAGGFDDHNATWGTALDYRLAVLAKRLTRRDIFDAMIARRFFSTEDKNIALSFTVNGQEMGSAISGAGAPHTASTEIRTFDGDNELFTEVVLFDKDHNKRRTWHPGAAAVDMSDTLMIAAGDYYYVKVTEQDGNEAISSPIWVSGP